MSCGLRGARLTALAPVPLALCGLGRFARRRVLPALSECPDFTLSAVVSGSGPSFHWDGAAVPVFPSLDAFLATKPLGAIYILTPNHMHASQTCAALTAGLDVLCEKPMATRAADAREMTATARRLGRHLRVAHALRDSAAMRLVGAWNAEGRIGEVTAARATVDFDLPPGVRPWASDRLKSGGGVLIDVGVHCIDLFRGWFPGTMAATDAVFTVGEAPGVDTTAHARFQVGAVECVLDIAGGRPYASTLDLLGTSGRIVVRHFTASWGEAEVECRDAHGHVDLRRVDVSSTHRDHLTAFARSLRDTPDYRRAEDAAASVALIEQLYNVGRIGS